MQRRASFYKPTEAMSTNTTTAENGIEQTPEISGPHVGLDADGAVDHHYFRCSRCGLESTDRGLEAGCFRCGAGGGS
ncbi:hypothetical protein DMJ13_27410 [halophilic archaeon]|nr:hypothetical protein DMJ13_27410 [halophilic archaeon]